MLDLRRDSSKGDIVRDDFGQALNQMNSRAVSDTFQNLIIWNILDFVYDSGIFPSHRSTNCSGHSANFPNSLSERHVSRRKADVGLQYNL